ncbi:putative nucleoside-diphosphate-sugar epimerase [Coniochaeta sp. 2T2.1]|nr:putative nucleoside-diphosphate-sugar epimerase [Coniochaeta sp. 2T2.1]
MHLILIGATGLVGSAVLDAFINMTDVSRISILSRRPVKMVEDASDPRISLEGANGCVWALGTSQSAVTREEYVKITTIYAVKAAEAFATLGSKKELFHFVFVSGDGATSKPGAFTPLYARVKGEAEVALAEVRKANPRLHANSVRPGFVDWAGHDAIMPYFSPRPMMKQIAIIVFRPVFRAALPGRCSPTQPLGRFLAEMAMGKWEEELNGPGFEKIGELCVVSNSNFRRLSGLDP